MPGRQRTVARKVADLHERLQALGDEVWRLMPEMYKENADRGNPIGAAWHNAVAGIADAYANMGELNAVLAERAARLPDLNAHAMPGTD